MLAREGSAGQTTWLKWKDHSQFRVHSAEHSHLEASKLLPVRHTKSWTLRPGEHLRQSQSVLDLETRASNEW